MRSRQAALWLAPLLLATVLAGCLGPADQRPTGEAGPADRSATHEGDFQPNLWLLDQPKPAATRVSGGAEPSVLATADGERLFIGDTSGVYRSTNGGSSWTKLNLPFITPVNCDGYALAEDAAGSLYVAGTTCAALRTARSDDGGASWTNVLEVLDVSPIADRPWIGAGPAGDVTVLFYDFGRTFSESCLRSDTGGLVFHDRSLLSSPPNAGNVVYDDAGRIHYAVDETLYTRNGQCRFPATSFEMADGHGDQVFTQVATDGDAVYLAVPGRGNVNIQVAGTTDRETRTVHLLDPAALETHTFATISAHGDEVAVAWYASETPGDPTDPNFDGAWNVYVARITDFWSATPTISYQRLSDEPNHVGDICMGGTGCGSANDRDLLDYFMIDHGPDGTLHVAYGHDGEGSSSEVRYARLPALST